VIDSPQGRTQQADDNINGLVDELGHDAGPGTDHPFFGPARIHSWNNRSVYLWTERMVNEEHLEQEGEFTYIDVGPGRR